MRQIPWTIGEIQKAIEMAQKGYKASEIAMELKGRTRNSVIGLLHRRKIVMGVYKRIPAPAKPRTRAPSAPRPISVQASPTPRDYDLDKMFVEAKKDVSYGKIDLIDSHRTQCKWIEGEGRMICGEPTVKGSSWCKEHYRRAFTPYSIARAAAAEMKRRREAEKWPERRKF